MDAQGSKNVIYEFDSYELDPAERRLLHGGIAVSLPPKAFETLVVLVENNGRLVAKETLLDRVWTDSFVEEGNLKICVHTLRNALAGSNFIETVPKKGYRFNAIVRQIEKAENNFQVEKRTVSRFTFEAAAVDRSEDRSEQNSAVLPFSLSKIYLGAGFCLVLLVVAVFALVSPRQGSSRTPLPAALEAYQKGDTLLQGRSTTCESIPYFQEAVDKDANFALAYANLAAAQAMCGVEDGAEQNVARAIELNPDLAEAQASDGFIKMFRHWDWHGAESALRRSVALDPNSGRSHHWLGVYLSIRGRFDEAQGEMKRAIEIDPESPLYLADLGQVYYFKNSYDKAADYCREALAVDPNFFFGTQCLRDIYWVQGDEKNAVKYFLENLRNQGAVPETVERAKVDIERNGFRHYLASGNDENIRLWNDGGVGPERSRQIADLYVALGDKEKALHWLAIAVEPEGGHVFYLPYVNVDPRYNFLRDDPRFQAILKKMNLG